MSLIKSTNYSEYHFYFKKMLEHLESGLKVTFNDVQATELIQEEFYRHAAIKTMIAYVSSINGEYASIKEYLTQKYNTVLPPPNVFTDSISNKFNETTGSFLSLAFNMLDGDVISFVFGFEKFIKWATLIYGSCWKDILAFDIRALAEIASRENLVACYQNICKHAFAYLPFPFSKILEPFDPIFQQHWVKEQKELIEAIECNQVDMFDFKGKSPSILFSGNLFNKFLETEAEYENWFEVLKYVWDGLNLSHLPASLMMLERFKCFADGRFDFQEHLRIRNYSVPFLNAYFNNPDPCYIHNILYLLEDIFTHECTHIQPLKDIYLISKQTDYPEIEISIPEPRRDFMRGMLTIFINEQVVNNEMFEDWFWPIFKAIGTLDFDSTFQNGFEHLSELFDLYGTGAGYPPPPYQSCVKDDIFNYQEQISTNFAFILLYAAVRTSSNRDVDKIFQYFNFLITIPAFPINMKGDLDHLGIRMLENRYELGRDNLFFTKSIVEQFIQSCITFKDGMFKLDTRFLLPYYSYDSAPCKDDMFNEDYDTLLLLNDNVSYQELLKTHVYFDILLRIKLQKYLPGWMIKILTSKQLVKIYLDISIPLRRSFAINEKSKSVKCCGLLMKYFSPKYSHLIKWVEIDQNSRYIYVNSVKTKLRCTHKQLLQLQLLVGPKRDC